MSAILRSSVASQLPRKIISATTQTTTQTQNVVNSGIRHVTTKPSGALLPDPSKEAVGLLGIGATVTVGLFLGAAISKHVASFLEENELFVPSDDDDDD